MAQVLIIGASKGIGLETTRQALEAGHTVRAFARSAADIRISDPKLQKVRGNALRSSDVTAAGVAVCRSDLAGLDYLQPAVERIGDVAGAGESGIFQHEHATFSLFGSDELNRSQELRTHIPVAPDGGNGG